VPAGPFRPSWREVVLLALAVGGGLWLGGRRDADGDDEEALRARGAAMAGGMGAGVAALSVRTTEGRVARLSQLGEPAVVMVVSRTCGVCKEALRDFAAQAAGRPLPRLWLVTLEGASFSAAMSDTAGVRGAVLAGPAQPAQEALFTFQIAGTPTFLALDARGRVQRVLPGYPGRAAMGPWLAVMRGERDAL
jgi:hypothetical protein